MNNFKHNFLITGGAGFIGSNIVERLVSLGGNVVILDNLSTGKIKNLEGFLDEKNCHFVEGTILDYDFLSKLIKKFRITHVSHQAAKPSVSRSIEDPLSTTETNVYGTVNVLKAAVDGKCRHIVFASSSSVYGDSKVLPKHEEMPLNPKSPYATSKAACELYLKTFFLTYRLSGIALRYFNVFGKRQDPSSQYAAVIPKFIKAAIHHEPIQVHGDGQQTRDFTFIGDVVNANILALKVNGAQGDALNIASSKRVSVLELAQKIIHLTGSRSPIHHGPPRLGDVRHSLADITRAKKELEYQPNDTLETGLEKSIDWYYKQYSKE